MQQGTLVGLSATDLTTIKNAALQCIVAGAIRGINYSIAGRAYTFPSLESAQKMLGEAQYALDVLNGVRSSSVRVNFNSSLGKGTIQTGL